MYPSKGRSWSLAFRRRKPWVMEPDSIPEQDSHFPLVPTSPNLQNRTRRLGGNEGNGHLRPHHATTTNCGVSGPACTSPSLSIIRIAPWCGAGWCRLEYATFLPLYWSERGVDAIQDRCGRAYKQEDELERCEWSRRCHCWAERICISEALPVSQAVRCCRTWVLLEKVCIVQDTPF